MHQWPVQSKRRNKVEKKEESGEEWKEKKTAKDIAKKLPQFAY